MGALEIRNKKLRCTRCLDIRRLLIIPSVKKPKIEITCHCNKSVENLIDFCNEINKVSEIKLVCSKCNREHIKHPRLCYDCLLIYCSKCCDDHLPNTNDDDIPVRASLVGHTTIHVEKSDYYCVDHQSNNFIGYCQQCLMNLCNECIKEGTHKTHHVDIFSVIKPSKEESDQIKTGIKNAENKIERNNKIITNFFKMHNDDERTKKIEEKYNFITEENKDIISLLKYCFDLYKSSKLKNYSIIYNLKKNTKFNIKKLELDSATTDEEKFSMIIKYLKKNALVLYKRSKKNQEKFESDKEEEQEEDEEEENEEEKNEENEENPDNNNEDISQNDNQQSMDENKNEDENEYKIYDLNDNENPNNDNYVNNKEDDDNNRNDDELNNDNNGEENNNNNELLYDNINLKEKEEKENKPKEEQEENKEENDINENFNINEYKTYKKDNTNNYDNNKPKEQDLYNYKPKKLIMPTIFDQPPKKELKRITSKDVPRPKKLKVPSVFEKQPEEKKPKTNIPVKSNIKIPTIFEKKEEDNKSKERAGIIKIGAGNIGQRKDFLAQMMEKKKGMGLGNEKRGSIKINKEEGKDSLHNQERKDIVIENNEGNTEDVINKVVVSNKKKKKPKRSKAFGFGEEFIELPKPKPKLEVIEENQEINENNQQNENTENIEQNKNNDQKENNDPLENNEQIANNEQNENNDNNGNEEINDNNNENVDNNDIDENNIEEGNQEEEQNNLEDQNENVYNEEENVEKEGEDN